MDSSERTTSATMACGTRFVVEKEIENLKKRQEALLERTSRLCVALHANEFSTLEARQTSILDQVYAVQQRFFSISPSPSHGGISPQDLSPCDQQAAEIGREGELCDGKRDGPLCQIDNSSSSSALIVAGDSLVEKRLTGILDAAVATFSFKRVPSDYYSRSFEERRDLLGASSIDHLCKTIVMVNTQAPESVKDCSDRNNSKYYLIVIQYTARLNAEKVKQFVYALNNGKLPKKKINMRLAPEEESNALTGFEHNAVTPFGTLTDIPVVISDAIVRLQPGYFWLGGGEVDLKLGIRTQDFIRILNPFIADCIY